MPKLYEYLGIAIFFYSNEHEPIHVHGRYQGSETKIEITLVNGVVSQVTVLQVKGKKPLPKKQLTDFHKLVELLADEIVQSWINYFIYHKKIVTKKISEKL